MALSFHPTTASLFGDQYIPADDDAADMSFLLQDVHPEVTDALLGFVYDPLDPAHAALDDLLNLPLHHGDVDVEQQHCAKKQRACGGVIDDDTWRGLGDIDAAGQLMRCNGGGCKPQVPAALPELVDEYVLPLPLPLPLPMPPPLPRLPEPAAFVSGANAKKAAGAGNVSQSVQSAAARQRRKRISEKTAELSRLIPGGHKMNTAEMLEAAARHVKLLQAQVGMLALMHKQEENIKMPSMAQEQMHRLVVSGGVQERLAAEGKCLVPRKLVDVMARDSSVKSNALVSRDLGRFVASLQAGQQ